MANHLSLEKQAAIVRCLTEGNSVRSTCRIVGVCKEAVLRLLCRLGPACSDYQARALRELPCKRVQCDEIFSYVGAREQNLPPSKRGQSRGTVFTHTAICADSKLMICWHTGGREMADTLCFMEDLASRLKDRVQITTDGMPNYPGAIEAAFGNDVDFGTEIKVFGTGDDSKGEARFRPAKITTSTRTAVFGEPDMNHVSTSYNERNNLTIRTQIKRFTRCTNAFSKKLENHDHAFALHAMVFNFCKIHGTTRVTPAMGAGVSDHAWEIEEVLALLNN